MRTLISLLVCAAVCIAADDKKPQEPKVLTEEIVLAGETFELEVAADDESRKRGWGGRDEIEKHGGMIFIFEQRLRRSFWMMDCIVDLDLVFLDHRGRIVAVHEMTIEPPQGANEVTAVYERRLELYYSRWPAQLALELRPGTIKRLDLKVGRLLELDLPRLKAIPDEVRKRRQEGEAKGKE